jgi:hypothetical protein
MKLACMAALLVAIVAVECFAQQTSAPNSTSNEIILQLLNGKNGKTIKDESPSIWLGNDKWFINPIPRTDSKGEILLEIGQAKPQEIRVMGNYYVDCRPRGNDKEATMKVRYSLNEIVSKGIVTENDCGKSRVDPIPGRLILYLRPMTFIEKWEL